MFSLSLSLSLSPLRASQHTHTQQLILQFTKNNPTAVLTEVADLLCMRFKQEYPNVQLLLRRTIQHCKEGAKENANNKKASSAAAKNNNSHHHGDESDSFHHKEDNLYSAYDGGGGGGGGGAGKTRKGVGPDGNKKKGKGGGHPGASRMKSEKIPGIPTIDDTSPLNGRRRPRSGRRGGGGGGGGGRDDNSQVPALPSLTEETSEARRERTTSGRGERITSGRGERITSGRSRSSDLQSPGKNIRQWMLGKQVKEKEREALKRRALEKEMKWIEKMALKQQERNRANRKMEEMNQAAVVIQNSFRGHAARKMTKTMKEEQKRRKLEMEMLGPSVEEESARLFDD